MLEWGLFLFGSAGLVLLSKHALLDHHSHGYPRFFAFEALLGIVILNASSWFDHPFSVLQVISWVLFVAAIALVLSAIRYLRIQGKPDKAIRDPKRLYFEKTTNLVTIGPYRYIRHPMYTSLLLFCWGVFLKDITLVTALLVLLVNLGLFLTAVYEERENLSYFGDEYTTYMKTSKRFIPFLW